MSTRQSWALCALWSVQLGLGACQTETGAGAEPDAVTPALDVGVAGDVGEAGDAAGGGAADASPLTPDGAPATDATTAADAGESPVEGTLHVLPERVELQLAAGPAPTQRFVVERRGLPGGAVGVPAERIIWTVDPPGFGSVDAEGLFTSAGVEGSGTVLATHDDDTARALVDVTGLGNVLAPGTPPDAPARFDGAGEAEGCAPRLEYPEPLTAIPRNLEGLTFQWAGNGHSLFRLRLQAGNLTLDWFTEGEEITPVGPEWEAALRNAAGGELRITLSGLGGRGNDACSTVPVSLLVDQSQLSGAIYYWSTSDSGILRIAIGETAPEPFLAPAVAPEINCPACHALSRDGQRIAVTRTTFPPFGELFVSQVAAPRMSLFNPAGVTSYFPSFSPDSNLIVGGSAGQLIIRDVVTGVETERLPLPMTHYGASPDWSWSEDRIVAAFAPRNVNPLPDVGVANASIAQWVRRDGVWEGPDVLVEREDEENDRPAFSPDGAFIAFQRSGVSGQMGQGMGNPSNSLWIIPAGGGAPPVDLARANQGPGLGNSWPKWAPTDRRGRLWLAFSSTRDYGHTLLQPAGGEGRPQLWVTGIDPDAPPGSDPSAPAFWLPYQNTQSGNHIPYWSAYEKE